MNVIYPPKMPTPATLYNLSTGVTATPNANVTPQQVNAAVSAGYSNAPKYALGKVLPAGGVGLYNIPTPESKYPTAGNPFAQTGNAPTTPSYKSNFGFDSDSLRSRISTGELAPEDALKEVRQQFMSRPQGIDNRDYSDPTADTVNKWKSQLFSSPLQINAGNKIGNLNYDGSISQLSTTIHQSNTTGAGESGQDYYTQPGGGMLKARPIGMRSPITPQTGLPQLPN